MGYQYSNYFIERAMQVIWPSVTSNLIFTSLILIWLINFLINTDNTIYNTIALFIGTIILAALTTTIVLGIVDIYKNRNTEKYIGNIVSTDWTKRGTITSSYNLISLSIFYAIFLIFSWYGIIILLLTILTAKILDNTKNRGSWLTSKNTIKRIFSVSGHVLFIYSIVYIFILQILLLVSLLTYKNVIDFVVLILNI